MESGKEKEKECGDREQRWRFGYGSVATRFNTPAVHSNFVVVALDSVVVTHGLSSKTD